MVINEMFRKKTNIITFIAQYAAASENMMILRRMWCLLHQASGISLKGLEKRLKITLKLLLSFSNVTCRPFKSKCVKYTHSQDTVRPLDVLQ